MIKVAQLRKMAWAKLRSAHSLHGNRSWDDATYIAGYGIEFILKARICVDHGLVGFPNSDSEFATLKSSRNGLWLKTHDLETLLNHSSLAIVVKQSCFNEWGACLQWNVNARYQPPGTATKTSAAELLRAVEVVMRVINTAPGSAVTPFPVTSSPYDKLRKLEHELAVEHGDFTFFALMRRVGSFDFSDDVVVAAPWIHADTRRGVQNVVNAIQKAFTADELIAVSGVVALDEEHPIVVELSQNINVGPHGLTYLKNCCFNDLPIEKALVLTCQRPVR